MTASPTCAPTGEQRRMLSRLPAGLRCALPRRGALRRGALCCAGVIHSGRRMRISAASAWVLLPPLHTHTCACCCPARVSGRVRATGPPRPARCLPGPLPARSCPQVHLP